VPFGEGVVKTYTDTSSGVLDIDLGHLESADVTVTTDYATARNIFVEQDPNFTMQAFISGKIKVEGDMLKMMALQGSMPQNEIAKTIAEEIKTITK
jgi:putative sterol carrier protein